jgi:tetrahydromethanopterin S-methyltransferase subunit G
MRCWRCANIYLFIIRNLKKKRIDMQYEKEKHEMKRKIGLNIGRMIGIGIAVVVGIIVLILVGGMVVQALWNWLVPVIFGLPQLDFWQALGLLVLTRILFGNIGGGRGPRYGGRRKGGHHGPPHLSPEERDHMKQSAAGEAEAA